MTTFDKVDFPPLRNVELNLMTLFHVDKKIHPAKAPLPKWPIKNCPNFWERHPVPKIIKFYIF